MKMVRSVCDHRYRSLSAPLLVKGHTEGVRGCVVVVVVACVVGGGEEEVVVVTVVG